jgi:endonuclease/exonuclease/phosphatase family metal-dependent hydrolase
MKNFILIILLIPTLIFSVENSIVPVMERFEKIENLASQKYSTNQFQEIQEALGNPKIRIVTYNMLFDLYDHTLEECNRWPARLPRIVELLEDMQPDVLGTQELEPHQVEQLMEKIGDTYTLFGPKDGILFRKDRFEFIEGEVVNKLTKVVLKDLRSNKCFAVLNIHFSFSDINKRETEARACHEAIEKTQYPSILMGDLNTFPNRPDLTKLPFLDGNYIHRILTKTLLKDAHEVSLLGHLGPISTFTNDGVDILPFKGVGTPGVMLDHFYVTDGLSVLVHATQSGTVDGHFPSDHMPLIIDLSLD